ncbi:MAG: hypothetical protein FWE45_00485 [Firmicutes bacterium]|nr:hypothetical protein [Bacillota bacterium]
MENTKDNDVAVLKQFLSCDLTSADEVFSIFQQIPGMKLYQGDFEKDRFLFKQGTREDRVTLVAHADTVFTGGRSLYGYGQSYGYSSYDYDFFDFIADGFGFGGYEPVGKSGRLAPVIKPKKTNTKQTIRSMVINGQEMIFGENPEVGIGADDRAGCAILWLMQQSGHNILVTDGEEIGCKGASYLMQYHPDIRNEINSSRYIMEFDRQGEKDYKCYTIPVSDEFKRYIEEKTGFVDAGITALSDVAVLSRNVCGVNMSVGYYREHSSKECINVNEWLNTLNLTRQMLSEKIPEFSLDESVRERLRFQNRMLGRQTSMKTYGQTNGKSYTLQDYPNIVRNYNTDKAKDDNK